MELPRAGERWNRRCLCHRGSSAAPSCSPTARSAAPSLENPPTPGAQQDDGEDAPFSRQSQISRSGSGIPASPVWLWRSIAQCNPPCKGFCFGFTFVWEFPASSMQVGSILPFPQPGTPHALLEGHCSCASHGNHQILSLGHGIMETTRCGLKRTLKVTSVHGQGHLPLRQCAQSPIQPGLNYSLD